MPKSSSLLAIIIFLVVLVLIGLSVASRYRKPLSGLVDGRLHPCPPKPNCICSEYAGQSPYRAIEFSTQPEEAWEKAVQAIGSLQGKVLEERDNYLHAVFTSRVFRFVDDLELRMDEQERVIHYRSASRTGYSDLGVNRKRVETLLSFFAKHESN